MNPFALFIMSAVDFVKIVLATVTPVVVAALDFVRLLVTSFVPAWTAFLAFLQAVLTSGLDCLKAAVWPLFLVWLVVQAKGSIEPNVTKIINRVCGAHSEK